MNIKPADECRFDIVSLGEVMLRLDPGEGRIRTARRFDVWEGGGEYNVARGLSRCFGLRAGLVSALARNEIGELIESLVLAGGVDTSFVQWVDFDGVGRRARNALNFTERGFGVRGAIGVSDRGHSAASQMRAGTVDWERLFATYGVRWFHTGGIFAGLSATTPDVVEEALIAARRHGTVTSYDLNYRPSLWKDSGGVRACQEVNRRIAKHVDVMIGNEEDFSACLGLDVARPGENLNESTIQNYQKMIESAAQEFPNFRMMATTLRTVRSATRNDWGAICWFGGNTFQSKVRYDLEILDRVGGGDSFASGLIYGMLARSGNPQTAVDFGAAHGALAMTTPGDTSMATLNEVERLIRGDEPRVQR